MIFAGAVPVIVSRAMRAPTLVVLAPVGARNAGDTIVKQTAMLWRH
jgi:hypothetical protein